MLQINGFAAVEEGDYVRVVPEAVVRQLALPVASGAEARLGAEYVTRIFVLKNRPATMLVPILRPLLPRQGHLAAEPCSNAIVIVDTYANTCRIEALVRSLDVGEGYKLEQCPPRERETSKEVAANPQAIRHPT